MYERLHSEREVGIEQLQHLHEQQLAEHWDRTHQEEITTDGDVSSGQTPLTDIVTGGGIGVLKTLLEAHCFNSWLFDQGAYWIASTWC